MELLLAIVNNNIEAPDIRFEKLAKFLILPLRFIWNLIHTTHICYPTKFEVSNSMRLSKIKFEVSLNSKLDKVLLNQLKTQKEQNVLTTLKNMMMSLLWLKSFSKSNRTIRNSIWAFKHEILTKVKFDTFNIKHSNSGPQIHKTTSIWKQSAPRLILIFWSWWNWQNFISRLEILNSTRVYF